MNDVLARQTRDIRTRPADVFALDHGDALSLPGKSPRGQCSTRAAAKNDDIVFLSAIFSHGRSVLYHAQVLLYLKHVLRRIFPEGLGQHHRVAAGASAYDDCRRSTMAPAIVG